MSRSLVTGAVLAALALSGLSSSGNTLAATSGDVASQEATTTFNVYLPLTHTDELEDLLSQQTDTTSINYRKWLTPAQFKQRFGPGAASFASARASLESAGFTVIGEHTQSLTVQGPVSAAAKLFSTQLVTAKTADGKTKWAATHHGQLNLPQRLAELGAIIPEFAPHLSAHVHSTTVRTAASNSARRLEVGGEVATLARIANTNSFFYANDMKEAYDAPSFRAKATPLLGHHPVQLAGVGATIGIVISSVINPVDLARSFDSTTNVGTLFTDVQQYSKVANLPVPTVTYHHVNGGAGPFDNLTPDAFEASLDTQMSLGTAPGAKEIVYDMPALTDADIMAAYTLVDDENAVDVVSSSFGECELDFTAAANGGVDFTSVLRKFHQLFQQGNAQGITFLASSGDSGAPACIPPAVQSNPVANTRFIVGVENPADDPNVTAVGGTNLQTVPSPTAGDVTYESENADFDPRLPTVVVINNVLVNVDNNTWGSGGGFSTLFAKPAYQNLVNTGSATRRAVPDVSLMMGGCPGNADVSKLDCTTVPRSGSIVFVGGFPTVLIGTSSSSPQLAGVLAIAVARVGGRLGNVNPEIYGLSALQSLLGGANAPEPFQFFHRNISGSNNGFNVKPGQAYSEVLGNGTLNIRNFLGLQGVPAAGAPGTASNP